MWNQFLTTILTEMRQFGLHPQPPCGMQEREELSHAVSQAFDAKLPNEYMELLSIVDGLEWNGLVIFSSRRQLISGYTDRHIDGIIDRNSMYRDNPDMAQYLVLGDDGTVLFSLDCQSGKYVVLTTVGLTVLETHSSCSDLLSSAMKSHL